MSESELTRRLDDAIAGVPGIVGITAQQLGGERRSYRHNGDEMFPTASTFKVPVLVQLLRRAARGEVDLACHHRLSDEDWCAGSGIMRELSPGTSVSMYDLAVLMIIISDNTATDICLEAATVDGVSQLLGEAGCRDTSITMGCKGILAHAVGIEQSWPSLAECREAAERLKRGEADCDGLAFAPHPPNVVTTPDDMVRLLTLVESPEDDVFGQDVAQEALTIMKRQRLTQRIPRLLPDGVTTASKTGTLSGPRHGMYNDVALVYPPDAPAFAVAIYTREMDPECDGDETVARLGRLVYRLMVG